MAKKEKKFTTGTVTFEFKKPFPYMTNHDVDENQKFTGKAIKDGKEDRIQFTSGTQKRLRYDLAGKLVANGYGNILDARNRKVNTKELVGTK